MSTLPPKRQHEQELLDQEADAARRAMSASISRLHGLARRSVAGDIIRRHPLVFSACIGAACGAGIYALLRPRPALSATTEAPRDGMLRCILLVPLRMIAMSWLSGFLAHPAIQSMDDGEELDPETIARSAPAEE